MKFVLLLLLVGIAASSQSACNDNDRKIHASVGKTFKTLFRSFAGLWVSKSSYEVKIQKAIGLSPTCSQCYGKAYMCAWASCKRSCYYESEECDQCLLDNKCTTDCDTCTGFFTKA